MARLRGSLETSDDFPVLGSTQEFYCPSWWIETGWVALWDIPAHLPSVCKLARQSAEGCEWNAELLQPRRITRLFRTRLPPSRWEQLQAILQSAVERCCRPPGRFESSALKHPIRGAGASTSLRRVCLAMQAVVANRPFQAPNPKNKCGTPPPLVADVESQVP
jgi:hypothetical protein